MVLTAALITKYPVGLFDKFENLIRRIADRPYLSAALIAAVAAGARLVLSPFLGTPEPVVQDEFSLMLQAKTYLTGHLANHVSLLPDFETVYVLLSPTYASIYPVLRSFPLFLGYWLGIGAWGGVLLSMVALTVAVYWMVREWINARYASIAALIVIIRYGLFGLWVNSYWGGAFTALGGVLLVGGYKAVRSRPTFFSGAIVGLGVLILMTTRPYEGTIFAIPFGIALVVQFVRAPSLERRRLIPAGLAAAALVVAGFGLTLADNQAVTGDWKLAPYSLHTRQVGHAPFFLVESRKPQEEGQARYALTRADISSDDKYYAHRKTWAAILSTEMLRSLHYWSFYVGFALLIPFVLGIYALRRETTILFAAATLAAGLSLGTFFFAHYAAPGFGFATLATMAGFSSLRQWRPWGYPYGLALSRVLPLTLVLGSVIPLSSVLIGRPVFTIGVDDDISSACCWLRPRSLHVAIASEIDRYESRNLILVDTGPKAPIDKIIVWNEPDIDNERTIWVNDDAEFNRLAIDRYPGRRIWRLGWLDNGGTVCLQLFQSASSLAGAPPDVGRLAGDEERGWTPGSPERCPGGLVHAAVRTDVV